MVTASAKRIASLIKVFKHESARDFRMDLRKLLAEDVRARELTPEAVLLLDEVPTLLERWLGGNPADVEHAVADWLDFRQKASAASLPAAIPDAVGVRIPDSALKAFDWSPVVIGTIDRKFCESLISLKLISRHGLAEILNAHPDSAYRSAGLDVLLEAGVCPSRLVWVPLVAGHERPAGLMSWAEALAESYSHDNGGDALPWLADLLQSAESLRNDTLRQFLRDLQALDRLLLQLGAPKKSSKDPKRASNVADLVASFVDVCVETVQGNRRTAGNAEWAVASLLLLARGPRAAIPDSTAIVIESAAAKIAQVRALSSMGDLDRGGTLASSFPIVIPPKALYSTVQEYLNSLPAGDTSEGPERGAQYQQFLGKKDVIAELLPLLDGSSVPREHLRAALFNVGLREISPSDSETVFDPRRHDATASGILPGDRIKMLSSGWQLGTGASAIVLQKARVTTN